MHGPRAWVICLSIVGIVAGCNSGTVQRARREIQATPPLVDFELVVDQEQHHKAVELKNIGNAPLTFQSARIDRNAAGAFSVQGVPSFLAVGATATITVTLVPPPSTGLVFGQLVLVSDASNSPELAIPLSANVVVNCASAHCDSSATCVESSGVPTCTCPENYKGNGLTGEMLVCTPIDPCETEHGGCDAHASCTMTGPGTNTCSCDSGYAPAGAQSPGTVCTPVDPCETDHGGCDAHATCTMMGPGKNSCTCDIGYAPAGEQNPGTVCAPIDPCETDHGGCDMHASCRMTGPGANVCTCAMGYSPSGEQDPGTVCKAIDSCQLNHGGCDLHATCTSTGPGTNTCTCDSGYSPSGAQPAGTVCAAIDPCQTNNGACGVHATCTMTGPGTNTCTCNSGYSPSGAQTPGTVCQAIDSCQLNHGGCDAHATCTSTGPGTNTCTCDSGYSPSGAKPAGTVCAAIDPCQTNNGGCDVHATCAMTGPGTNACTCNSGYSPSGAQTPGTVCQAIDSCQLNHGGCDAHATCTSTGPGTNTCTCDSGYSPSGAKPAGTVCAAIDPCQTNNGGCDVHATCAMTGPGTNTCTCNSGYIPYGAQSPGTVCTAVGSTLSSTPLATIPTCSGNCWFGSMSHSVFTNSSGDSWLAATHHRYGDTKVDKVAVYYRPGNGSWSLQATPFVYDYSVNGASGGSWAGGMPGTVTASQDGSGLPLIMTNNQKGSGYWFPGRSVYIRQDAGAWQAVENVLSDEALQTLEGNSSGTRYSGFDMSLMYDPTSERVNLLGWDGCWYATKYHAVVSSAASPSSTWDALSAAYTQTGVIDRGAIFAGSQDIRNGNGLQVFVDAPNCTLRGRRLQGGGTWGATNVSVALGYSACNSSGTSTWGIEWGRSETLLSSAGNATVFFVAKASGTSGPLTLIIMTESNGQWSSVTRTVSGWGGTGDVFWRAYEDAQGNLQILHFDTTLHKIMRYDAATGQDTSIYTTSNSLWTIDAERHKPKVVSWTENTSSDWILNVADLP